MNLNSSKNHYRNKLNNYTPTNQMTQVKETNLTNSLPKLTQDETENLNCSVTTEEVETAIKILS